MHERSQVVIVGDGFASVACAKLSAGADRVRVGNVGISQGRGGRIDVRPDLSVPGYPKIFAVGDIANIPYGEERPLPQLGGVARQSGSWAARNSDATSSRTDGVPFPMHVLAINALGLHLPDDLQPGGTGSPVNPIAVF